MQRVVHCRHLLDVVLLYVGLKITPKKREGNLFINTYTDTSI